jgi:predicted Fe-Mo cluster-binding NifX family protein
MTVCVTAAGKDWEASTQPNFGRAAFFLFIEPEAQTIDAVQNQPGAHGAGVQAAQIVAQHAATAVITGSVGPNAFQGLSAAGIDVYVGATGTVREAFDAYRAGELKQAASPTGRSHQGGRR